MQIIEDLKNANQYFEFYPTTSEIIEKLKQNISDSRNNILDIGAGKGDVLIALRDKAVNLYAIEKSDILIQQLPEDIFVIGTDFHNQTIIDKKVDIIFSNPPFSEFEYWCEKIINEANSKKIFFVIPQRWKKSKLIQQAIENREASCVILGEYTFDEAERKARCTVELIQITMNIYGSKIKKDPFVMWFNNTFSNISSKKQSFENQTEHIKNQEIVKGRNLIDVLVEMYDNEMNNLLKSYESLCNISPILLEEIGVNRNNIIENLKQKIENLKIKYWKELFNNFEKLACRLTVNSRRKMFEILTKNTYVDFNNSNAYAIIIWAIKNANKYTDKQIIALYKDLSDPKSCLAYKSNKKFHDNNWRYRFYNNEITHYKLDYRIVSENFHAFMGYEFERENGININSKNKIDDICTVAKTLGFNVIEKANSFEWVPGKNNIFYYENNNIKKEFMRIKLFLNGNAHIKFDQKFMLKLNVEAARLLGWIHNKQEASTELNEKIENINFVWESTEKIALSDIKMITM